MADPFGIVGVIGVVSQIAQLAVKLGLDWKDAPVDVKRFITEIHTLKTVLSETHANILVNDEFKNAFDGRHSTFLAQIGDPAKPTNPPTNTSAMVSACKHELDSLLDDLTKRAQGHRVGWERLRGAFLARKTRETVENLQRQCGTLNSLMAVDALALGARIHKEVSEARKEQQRWQADRENKLVLDWVTTDEYSRQQSDFIRRRKAGTGQWLLDSTEYQQWTETAKQTLFCPGIPGAGKTILTSIVVDGLHARFRDDVHVGIAYLYCNFRRQADQKVEDLLSNLVRQLSQDQSSLPECLRILYDKHKGRTRPSLDELSRALETVANLFSRIFIVVDALDECQLYDGSRSKFLATLFALQSKTGANIFATSRFILDVTERFKDHVSLEIRAHPGDVQRYIEGNMAHMPLCVARSPDLQKEIVTKIVQAVDGMYVDLRSSTRAVLIEQGSSLRNYISTPWRGKDLSRPYGQLWRHCTQALRHTIMHTMMRWIGSRASSKTKKSLPSTFYRGLPAQSGRYPPRNSSMPLALKSARLSWTLTTSRWWRTLFPFVQGWSLWTRRVASSAWYTIRRRNTSYAHGSDGSQMPKSA